MHNYIFSVIDIISRYWITNDINIENLYIDKIYKNSCSLSNSYCADELRLKLPTIALNLFVNVFTKSYWSPAFTDNWIEFAVHLIKLSWPMSYMYSLHHNSHTDNNPYTIIVHNLCSIRQFRITVIQILNYW